MEGPTLWGLAIAFAILFMAFRALELFRPRGRRLPILRKGLLTDGASWLFTPFVTKAIHPRVLASPYPSPSSPTASSIAS